MDPAQPRRWRCLAALVVTVLAGCCFFRDNRPPDPGAISEFPVGNEWERTVSPWRESTEFWISSHELEFDAIKVCMNAEGFSYPSVDWGDDFVYTTYLNPLNEIIAREWGYDYPDGPNKELPHPLRRQ